MRIAPTLLVGIVVTTGFLAVRFLTERDQTHRSEIGNGRGAGGTDDPTTGPTQDDRQKLRPGQTLTISLSRESAPNYGSADANDAYAALAVLTAAGRGIYDTALSRAASETAILAAQKKGAMPEAVTTFLLHSSGAPDSTVARFSLATNDDGEGVVERAIDEALSSPPTGLGALYFGVGETATPDDPHTRRIVVLMSRRAYELERSPRRAELNGRWEARGVFDEEFSSATAKVLYPDGRLEEADLRLKGRSFVLRLETGTTAGQLAIGIDAVGGGGPTKLLQLSVTVGEPLARELSIRIGEPDPAFATLEEAESHAASLLAEDRAKHGAPPLEIDPELTEIARGHSEDMAAAMFFAHQSPTTGLAGDRIEAAGYRASGFAENLAKNDNLAEAERSLLESVGHRANLLSHDFSHVGVGLARSVERGMAQWYVTQVFARKTVDIDADVLTANLFGQIAEERRRAGLGPLDRDADLEKVAQRGAKDAARGDTDGIAQRLGKKASALVGRSVSVSVQVIYSEGQFAVPDMTADKTASALGVGVFQSRDDTAGRIGVVTITSRER